VHANIGILYSEFSFILGAAAFFQSLIFRAELSTLGPFVLFGDGHFYNGLVTAHGLVIVFGFIMPIAMGGVINFLVPILLFAPDMVFPRMNNLSLWVFVGGVCLLVVGFFSRGGIAGGWTLYPPLACWDFHSSLSMDFSIGAVHLLGISSILNSINILATAMAAKGIENSAAKLNLIIFAAAVTSILLILVAPVLAVGVTLIFLDRNINTGFLDATHSGDEIIFQHIF